MKTIIALLILSCVIALPVPAELTDADLDKIRLIVNESEKRMRAEFKTEITASENRMKQYIDLKIQSVEGRITGVEKQITGVEGRIISVENSIGRQNNIIIACIAIPMAIIAVMVAWRSLKDTSLQKQIDTLSEKLETQ